MYTFTKSTSTALAPLFASILALALVLATPAFGGDIGAFNATLNDAYASYRAALFKSNAQDQTATAQALGAFQKKWRAIESRYGQTPPPHFAEDPAWNDTLNTIANLAEQAQRQTEAGALADAHNTLEGVRDELAELRERNGVFVFSDKINAYHTEMEHLLLAGYQADTLNAENLNAIREQTGVLGYLASEIERLAPADLSSNDEFKILLGVLHGSVANLAAALDSGDATAVVKAIKALKPAYAKLFVKFG